MDSSVSGTLVPYLLAALAGGAVGGLFFWGLWLSLEFAGKRQNRALILVGSFLFRAAVAVGGLLLILHLTDVYGLAASMVGFLIARVVVTRALGRSYG